MHYTNMALLPAEDEERGGRSDVTNSACAEEAKGGGLDPMALSATPLPPAPNDPRRMAASCQFGGQGEPWQRVAVALSEKNSLKLYLRRGLGGRQGGLRGV